MRSTTTDFTRYLTKLAGTNLAKEAQQEMINSFCQGDSRYRSLVRLHCGIMGALLHGIDPSILKQMLNSELEHEVVEGALIIAGYSRSLAEKIDENTVEILVGKLKPPDHVSYASAWALHEIHSVRQEIGLPNDKTPIQADKIASVLGSSGIADEAKAFLIPILAVTGLSAVIPPMAESLSSANPILRKSAADALCRYLDRIPTGNSSASQFHEFMFRVVPIVASPMLRNPVKEQEVDQGRKRIDFCLDNVATSGFFHSLRESHKIPCPYVFFECKNYNSDPENPELDQITGRFSDKRGEFGAILCRKVDDRQAIIEKCVDIVNRNHGYVLVLDDNDLKRLIGFHAERSEEAIDSFFRQKLRELILNPKKRRQ